MEQLTGTYLGASLMYGLQWSISLAEAQDGQAQSRILIDLKVSLWLEKHSAGFRGDRRPVAGRFPLLPASLGAQLLLVV